MTRAFVRLAVALLVGAACSRPPPPPPDDPLVHTLTLPSDLSPELPEDPGRTELVGNCVTCHSSRYVTNQPRLARKSWQAVVDKMKTVYGAPVDPEAAPKIVDYLVATHGAD
jgi:hypothetical protein